MATSRQLKLKGIPAGGGEPLEAGQRPCAMWAVKKTMEPFNQNLRGANTGDHKNF